ncbi:MAG: ATP synthase subunit C [Vicinamibacterales bacterium]|nr:ATP synthase subunit C [Vicinamibacterales bacterium]MDP7690270.1 ATP synthase subunit C [Vicinamibacterales bacterium]HJN46827.1 ATP synthase subunit C [Vicinamibacterales bacterium]
MTTTLLLATTVMLPATLILVGWAGRAWFGRRGPTRPQLRQAIAVHLLVFCVAYCGVLFLAFDSLQAQEQAGDTLAVDAAGGNLSLGDGLGMVGVALSTGLSVLGAGYAVGVVGAAALGAIAEKPELFGRTLVFIGLAEGLAIYGLIVSILILGRLG